MNPTQKPNIAKSVSNKPKILYVDVEAVLVNKIIALDVADL